MTSLLRWTLFAAMAGLATADGLAQQLPAADSCDPLPVIRGGMMNAPQVSALFRAIMARRERKAPCVADGPTVQLVGALLEPLARVADAVVQDSRFVVVKDAEANASAQAALFDRTGRLRAGLIVVGAEFVDYLSAGAELTAKRTGKDSRLVRDVYLSTVLGHEIGHLLRKHVTDTTCARPGIILVHATNPTGGEGQLRASGPVNVCPRFNQQQELQADSTAAILLVAAYHEGILSTVAELPSLWEYMEAGRRRYDQLSVPGYERVLGTHPSHIRRVAQYLRVWASYLEQQDRYDAATLLIASNFDRARASAMLDTVERALPGLDIIKEARASLAMRAWLSTVPILSLQLRPTVGVVRARFVEGSRGERGDPQLLLAAKRTLLTLPNLNSRGASLSNLSIIASVEGSDSLAVALADSAAVLLPNDIAVANNRGFVLYRAGLRQDAQQLFAAMFESIYGQGGKISIDSLWRRECIRRGLGGTVYPHCFNYARATYGVNPSAGARLLRVFADSQAANPWGMEAARVLGRASKTVANSSGTDWNAKLELRPVGDSSIRVWIGMPLLDAIKQLGQGGVVTRSTDGYEVRSAQERVTVFASPGDPTSSVVTGLATRLPGTWKIGSVFPGMPRAELESVVGAPSQVGKSEALYELGGLILYVEFAGEAASVIIVTKPAS
ncbi:MAG: M48 family metalloprotease [Gemmatimonadaceae bacterium]